MEQANTAEESAIFHRIMQELSISCRLLIFLRPIKPTKCKTKKKLSEVMSARLTTSGVIGRKPNIIIMTKPGASNIKVA
jgi:hypothetical protein